MIAAAIASALLMLSTSAFAQAEIVHLQRGLNTIVRAMGGARYVPATLGAHPTRNLQQLLKERPSLLTDPYVLEYMRAVRANPDDAAVQAITPHHLRNLRRAIVDLPSSSLSMLDGTTASKRMMGCAEEKVCGLDGLMNGLADAGTFAQFEPPWVTALKNENVLYQPTTPLQNLAFIEASRATDGAAFYFQVENAVLKLLNDHYFHDRELSHAVSQLYKRIFFEHLNENLFLSERIQWVEVADTGGGQTQARYADYKSIRLAFTEDTPEVRAALDAVYRQTTTDFLAELAQRHRIRYLTDNARHRLVRDPATWFLAGMGKTSDQASWAARYARRGGAEDGYVPVQAFDDEKALTKFRGLMERFETNIGMLADRCGESCGILQQHRGGLVLRRSAIEILRKVAAQDETEYIQMVQRRMKIAFGVDIGREEVLLLQNIMHITENFAPSIYIEHQAIVDLADAPAGLMAVDLAGQNSRNLHQVMRKLVEAYETRGNVAEFEPEATRTLALIRDGQDTASRAFDLIQTRLLEAIERSGLEGADGFSQANGVLVSGDDMVFAPAAPLTSAQKRVVVATAGYRAHASQYRITFVPEEYALSGRQLELLPDEHNRVVISDRELAQFIVLGEDLEKAIRLELLERRADMESVLIAVDVIPKLTGFNEVRLLLAGRNSEMMQPEIINAAARIVEGWRDEGRYVDVLSVSAVPRGEARLERPPE